MTRSASRAVKRYPENLFKGTYRPMTREEERALALRWKNDRDFSARAILVENCLLLALKYARKFCGNNQDFLKDLYQEGSIGILEALDRFDPDNGARLATYSMWWIKAYIRNEHKRQPKENSLNENVADDNTMDQQDLLIDEGNHPESILGILNYGDTEQIRQAINYFLPERDRFVILERYFSEFEPTLEDIGNNFEPPVSRERIRQIELRALNKLRKILRKWKDVIESVNLARTNHINLPQRMVEMTRYQEAVLDVIREAGGPDGWMDSESVLEAVRKKGYQTKSTYSVGQACRMLLEAKLIEKRVAAKGIKYYRLPRTGINNTALAVADTTPNTDAVHKLDPAANSLNNVDLKIVRLALQILGQHNEVQKISTVIKDISTLIRAVPIHLREQVLLAAKLIAKE